jgi:hypothetical protein
VPAAAAADAATSVWGMAAEFVANGCEILCTTQVHDGAILAWLMAPSSHGL